MMKNHLFRLKISCSSILNLELKKFTNYYVTINFTKGIVMVSYWVDLTSVYGFTIGKSYTYMHNHKVLNNKPYETEIDNCNSLKKSTCPLPSICQIKSIVYQANIDCDIAGYKQKCYLVSRETTFKDPFGNR